MKKEIREEIWRKYRKRCAYCGKKLEYTQMQVDHIKPRWHNDSKEDCNKLNITKGENHINNYNPSCVRCNRWKKTFSIEVFRNEIQQQLKRLRKNSSNYRMALDYGMIIENNKPIEFWFEGE